ncbi:MAG: hypothetical protein OXC18_20425 [Desulfurellaceae bacterium]|nr:hypothetical protein [Desulfurellaceae bacterium]
MSAYTTVFGSLAHYEKGRVEIIQDKARHYAFSNIFEVASQAQPYEKTAVAKNLEYVVEVLRAEGRSDWFTAAHDEFAVVMDGHLELHLVKLDDPAAVVSPDAQGSVRLPGSPTGKKMGWIKLRRGHQALLPAGAAYQFIAEQPSVILLQTLQGPLTVEKWADICEA